MTPLIPSGNNWITTQDQPFILSTGETIVIPKGYIFDGHSLPPITKVFMNPYSYDMYAALLHDYFYEFRIGTRYQADLEYLLLMEKLGTNVIRRYTFYYTVRLFSWIWWYT